MSQATIAAKAKFVEEFAEELKSAKSIVVINYLGLTVDQVTAFRAELRESNAKMKVVKNTYLRRAAAQAGLEDLASVFVGPSAVIYTDDEDNVTAPARIAADPGDHLVALVALRAGGGRGCHRVGDVRRRATQAAGGPDRGQQRLQHRRAAGARCRCRDPGSRVADRPAL